MLLVAGRPLAGLLEWIERSKKREKFYYKLQGNVIGEYSRTFTITYTNRLILKLTSMCVE